MTKHLFICDRIYTQRGCVDGGVVVQGGKFEQIYQKENLPKDFDGEIIDYKGFRIIPGLIEMHIHGYKGWSAMEASKSQILGLSKSLVTAGITAYTPTNHYSEDVFENNRIIAELMNEKPNGARILGIHMEGPFISKHKLGSVEEDEVKVPSIELMDKYLGSASGKIVTVTMAPEEPNGMELVDYLVSKGINVCIGHSNATFAEATEAINRGAIISQKTGNCLRGMHHREMGALGAVLLDERIFNEVNSDLEHVSKPFLELIYRLKGKDKLCVIADTGVMSGMRKGKYMLPDRGEYSVGPDTLLHISDGTIDGSIYSMFYGLTNWVEVMGIPMEEAVVMSSLNPAKVLKIDHQKGSISEHKDADFVIIDDNYSIISTYVEGVESYSNTDSETYENMKMYEYLIEEF